MIVIISALKLDSAKILDQQVIGHPTKLVSWIISIMIINYTYNIKSKCFIEVLVGW